MYYYLNIFFIFSILGHIIENLVYVHVDSGILYGFWTPIYGFGSLLILFINHIINKTKIKMKPFSGRVKETSFKASVEIPFLDLYVL